MRRAGGRVERGGVVREGGGGNITAMGRLSLSGFIGVLWGHSGHGGSRRGWGGCLRGNGST